MRRPDLRDCEQVEVRRDQEVDATGDACVQVLPVVFVPAGRRVSLGFNQAGGVNKVSDDTNEPLDVHLASLEVVADGRFGGQGLPL